jgi:hypothetical protein
LHPAVESVKRQGLPHYSKIFPALAAEEDSKVRQPVSDSQQGDVVKYDEKYIFFLI